MSIRLLALVALLSAAAPADALFHRHARHAAPVRAVRPVEVWVGEDGATRPVRADTLAFKAAIEDIVRAARARPGAPAASGTPRIVYLADDVMPRGHGSRFRYSALLTDRGYRTTRTLRGSCAVAQMRACAWQLYRTAQAY